MQRPLNNKRQSDQQNTDSVNDIKIFARSKRIIPIVSKTGQKKPKPQKNSSNVYRKISSEEQKLAQLKNEYAGNKIKLQQKKEQKMVLQDQIKYICLTTSLSLPFVRSNYVYRKKFQKIQQLRQQIYSLQCFATSNMQQQSKLSEQISKLKRKSVSIYKVVNLRA